jgi:hypothetical protein
MSRPSRQAAIAWAIFVFLCSVYLVTYNGLFRSVDELALFALTESLVQTRSMQTPQLAFASYHNVVGRLEPLHSLLAVPLYWLAVQSDRLGNVQTVMLLNVLITAATGGVLFVLLSFLGHPPRRAVLTALIYGLATIAWPYSRSFLREPLVALLLALAALGSVRWRQTRRAGFVALTLSCMILALFAKVTSALAWPGFALAFLLETGLSRRVRIKRLLVVLLFGILGGVGLSGAYVMRRERSLLWLFSALTDWRTPSLVFSRMFGLTFGAGRGLFLFSPVLLLALPGLVMLWRKRRTEAIGISAILAVFLVGYSNYADWHGGLIWGSRFLFPVVPLLLLPVAEWLAAFSEAPARRGWQAVTGLWVVLSLVIQVVASTTDNSLRAGAGSWGNLIDYAHSPVVRQLASWRPASFDMLWWHGPIPTHLEQGYVDGRIAFLPLACAIGAAVWLIAALRRLRAGAKPLDRRLAGVRVSIWGGGLGGLFLVAGMLVLLWHAPTATPGYLGANPAELRQVAEIVNQDRDEPHVIVTVSNDFHVNVLLNYFKGRFVHYWISPMQTDGFEGLLAPAGAFPPLSARSLRLIVDRVHIQPDRSGRDAEFWLNAHLHRYFVDWVGGGYQVYSYLYPLDEMPLQPVDYRWGDGLKMMAYGMTPRVVVPGEPVWLEFHCAAWQPPNADYDIFVQFLSPDKEYVNGTDGPPQFGASLTSRWKPGETIVDRRAFFVPGDAAPGTYRVIAGFYANGQRQPVYNGTGRLLGTHIELGTIEVESCDSPFADF